MVTYKELLKLRPNRIIANTRPAKADVYLDGEIVTDASGRMAKTPTIIYNATEGMHNVTFSRPGYNEVTIGVNVIKGLDCHARAILNTSTMIYPQMLSSQSSPIDTLQPSPGWPYLPIPQIPFGHMVASTIPDGADIYIDNQPVRDINGQIATTPSSVVGIITGIHNVTFKKVGYMDTSITIGVQNGLYSDAHVILQPIAT